MELTPKMWLSKNILVWWSWFVLNNSYIEKLSLVLWIPQYRLDWSSWTRSSWRATKVMKGLECLLWGKGWGSWACLATGKDNWEGTPSMSTNIWTESGKRMEPGSSSLCWAIGQEALGRNWWPASSTWTWEKNSLLCSDRALEPISREAMEFLSLEIPKNHLDAGLRNVL